MIVHEQTGINFLWVNDKTQQLLIVDHRPGTVLLINELDESIFNLQNNYFNPAAAKSLQSYPTLCDSIGMHFLLQCMKVKSESEVAQSCLTLLDPMVCSLPGSSVHGIFQARVLEWGAIAFSRG